MKVTRMIKVLMGMAMLMVAVRVAVTMTVRMGVTHNLALEKT